MCAFNELICSDRCQLFVPSKNKEGAYDVVVLEYPIPLRMRHDSVESFNDQFFHACRSRLLSTLTKVVWHTIAHKMSLVKEPLLKQLLTDVETAGGREAVHYGINNLVKLQSGLYSEKSSEIRRQLTHRWSNIKRRSHLSYLQLLNQLEVIPCEKIDNVY
jgi:hypothetical protein